MTTRLALVNAAIEEVLVHSPVRNGSTRRRLFALLCVLAVVVTACGSDDDGDDAGVTPDPGAAIAVADLVDGEALDATVIGFVIWDTERARLCDLIMESYPPQCGGPSVEIANPDVLDTTLDEASGVRWTPNAVELAGSYDGSTFTLSG